MSLFERFVTEGNNEKAHEQAKDAAKIQVTMSEVLQIMTRGPITPERVDG